jgi:DNA-binding LacI/PurR family transcriptional regulator/DNA-binding transcriptional regulator YhcF (GntR family)
MQSAVHKAIQFIDGIVQQRIAAENNRLPTTRELAKQAGLSPATMSKAVKALKDKGILASRQGGTITIPAVRSSASPTHRKLPDVKWRRLAESIAADVTNGRYTAGAALPSTKTLQSTHSVSWRTLRKALAALAREGVITPSKRHYVAPALRASVGLSSVVLAVRTNAAGTIERLGPRTLTLVRILENRCHRAGCNLEILPYDYVHRRLHPNKRTSQILEGRGTPVIGFIVWASGVVDPRPTAPNNLANLLRGLIPLGRPISIFDEGSVLPERLSGVRGERIHRFSLSNSPTSGKRVGRFLLGKGHRHVAYVSPMHRAWFSPNRLQGIENAFSAAGLRNGVSAFVNEQVEGMDSYFRNTAVIGEQLRDITGAFQKAGVPMDDTKAMLARAILVEEKAIVSDLERFVLAGPMVPLMQQALADDTITAWVTPNDNIALACLDYLKERGVKVPEEIAMVGFDDIYEAFDAGLTSYNFNLEAAVDAFLGAVLGRQLGRQAIPGAPVEIEGYIVERRTTAYVRTVRRDAAG